MKRKKDILSLSLSTLFGFIESVGKYMEEKIDILVLQSKAWEMFIKKSFFSVFSFF